MHKPSSMQSSSYSEFDHWGSCSSAFTTEGRWDERGGCVLLLPAPASTQLLSSAGKGPGPGTIWRRMLSSPGWFYLSRGLAGTAYPLALILRAQLCSLCLGRQNSLLALLLHQGVTRLTLYTGDNITTSLPGKSLNMFWIMVSVFNWLFHWLRESFSDWVVDISL